MNFAFFLGSKAFAAVTHALFGAAKIVDMPAYASAAVRARAVHLQPERWPAVKVATVGTSNTLMRPLRVVRVIENGQLRTNVGRMVISGRMSDVCAELDRLAAREVSESPSPSRSIPLKSS